MLEYRLGYFARSLCGHDKDRLYLIVDISGEMIGLCDGEHRLLSHPKYKKKKHIQMMRSDMDSDAFENLTHSKDADRKIREMIREREAGRTTIQEEL